MAYIPRASSLAAVGHEGGIRLYYQSGNGNILEACNNTTLISILSSTRRTTHDSGDGGDVAADQSEDWFPGELHAACDPRSTLCAVEWSNGLRLGLFYQRSDGSIRLLHYPIWRDTGFDQIAFHGTSMAALWTKTADKSIFFFQDTNEYLCYRKARNWVWEGVTQLIKVAPGSSIAATSWRRSDLQDLRLYFQDTGNSIREYCGSFDGRWEIGAFNAKTQPSTLASLAAVSWGSMRSPPNLRVYVQHGTNIEEWGFSAAPLSWKCHVLLRDIRLQSTIAAVARESENDNSGRATLLQSTITSVARVWYNSSRVTLNLYWSDTDKGLHQRVWTPKLQWLDQTLIGYVVASRSSGGCWTLGNHFNDVNAAAADQKSIRKVCIRSGLFIDGISIEFTDGMSTDWHGGYGGNYREFLLLEGEDIVRVKMAANHNHIRRMIFSTSFGRDSDVYGTEGGSPELWECQGKSLAGFAGQQGRFLFGLMPLWREQKSQAGPAILTNYLTNY